MAEHVCPWWLGYLLINPWRRFLENPKKLLRPFVEAGMIVLEPGCGMGFFTLPLAQMVGPRGRVVAVDLQPRMLKGLNRRAKKAGLLARLDIRQARRDSLGVGDLVSRVDLALALHMMHEVPDAAGFLAQIHRALKPRGRLVILEPPAHVKMAEMAGNVAAAEKAGFEVDESITKLAKRSIVLIKPPLQSAGR